MLETVLSNHCSTLKSIFIGDLCYRAEDTFNATLFPTLKRLSLSRWQMDTDLRFTNKYLKLLGPNLEIFELDFTVYDQGGVSWKAFGSAVEIWLTELGKAAISRGAALQGVRIHFDPNDYSLTLEDGYPWDKMDQLRAEVFAPLHLSLEYTTPPIRKEDWLVYVNSNGQDLENCRTITSPRVDTSLVCGEWEEGEEKDDSILPLEPPGYYGQDIRQYFVQQQKAPSNHRV